MSPRRGDGSTTRLRIRVQGIVQGVGFRPFVHRLATELALAGTVSNTAEGVRIEVEGPRDTLQTFLARLRSDAPPLARILEVDENEAEPLGGSGFAIDATDASTSTVALISPDVATCAECLRELFDPSDRRHRYPFVNCTDCGPRYTIVRSIPYDRPNTSMACFTMCEPCAREYEDPGDRRFHAQPNACARCGPKVALRDPDGGLVACDDPIAETIGRLAAGAIVAVRGLGGFHLAVDARNDGAVRELRRRKGRAEKPFAMMARDLDTVRRHGRVTEPEARLLEDATRPIVLLRTEGDTDIATSVAPAHRELGFMLPATPLHHLLLAGPLDVLVMTSGNFTEEPIAIGNDEALRRLAPLADAFLVHDREILERCDDSIARVTLGETRLLRRSRGHAPAPVILKRPTTRAILACGGELKNTVALSRGNRVFLSQHIGDLDNREALAFFEDSIAHLGAILEIEPRVAAHDLHPEYLSTKWALERSGLPCVAVQHHHAHLASVMADNGVDEPALGIILDGTGYGTDGTIWGGELLIGDARSCVRQAWLEPLPMPGGAAAIREPRRMALAALRAAYGSELPEDVSPVLGTMDPESTRILMSMLEHDVNCPRTSGCGRLFDAVSAILGVCGIADYEAQAAIELEAALDESVTTSYDGVLEETSDRGALAVGPIVRAVADDRRRGREVGAVSASFHWTLVDLFVRAAVRAREEHGIGRVGLSGGVFQNVHLEQRMIARLREEEFEVLTHSNVPPGDGGLALGQIAVAQAMLGDGPDQGVS